MNQPSQIFSITPLLQELKRHKCRAPIALAAGALLIVSSLTVGQNASAAETNSPATNSSPASSNSSRIDFNSFRIVSERNVFDPTRTGRRSYQDQPVRRQAPSEWFTLVGTLSSDQGTFAFFNGTSSELRKTAKPGDSIAGYKITEISHDYVKLGAGSNQTINLPMQAQMRRQEGGPWSLGGRVETSASAPSPAPSETKTTESGTSSSTSSSSSSSNGAISDVIKRMMERRDKE